MGQQAAAARATPLSRLLGVLPPQRRACYGAAQPPTSPRVVGGFSLQQRDHNALLGAPKWAFKSDAETVAEANVWQNKTLKIEKI